jgi:hypothetical protein
MHVFPGSTQDLILNGDIMLYNCIACPYCGKWWNSIVIANDDNGDSSVKFMHNVDISQSFHWPQQNDIWDWNRKTTKVTTI